MEILCRLSSFVLIMQVRQILIKNFTKKSNVKVNPDSLELTGSWSMTVSKSLFQDRYENIDKYKGNISFS